MTSTYQPTYKTVTTLGDFGPWISKLILALPNTVNVNDVNTTTFNVFCSRREPSGEVLMSKKHYHREGKAAPSEGYVEVLAAYPCTETGTLAPEGSTFVALELPEVRLTKKVEGGVMGSHIIKNCFRVTQLTSLPGKDYPVCGIVFDEFDEDICPALTGWHTSKMKKPVDGITLEYGYYEPNFEPVKLPFGGEIKKPEKAALLIYLHGAGEGKGDTKDEGPVRAYVGNRVTALSQDPIQTYFDHAAWVLVPQSPTFWMDDGIDKIAQTNESIYVEPLKALIDEFIAAHKDQIDTSRIVIGGLSNGGFMTVRMCLDYPDFFAAGLPCCAPWFVASQTPEKLETLAKTPLWFTHSKGDELVDPHATTIPLVNSLKDMGANCHMTYFNHVEDLTGRYKNADGTPLRSFNHGVWTHQFNDFCRTDLDGTNVLVDGEPVGCWEWAARQRRA